MSETPPPPPLFLDREAVERNLTPDLCLRAMEGAFRSLARGEALQPLRTLLTLPSQESAPGGRHFLVMPGHLGIPGALGAKLLTLFEGNHARGLPSHQGIIVLFDLDTGAPRAVADAASVTALRTAAASALATRLLAREDAGELAILGSGVQARSHLDALLRVRPIRRIRVWSRTPEHGRAFVAEARSRLANREGGSAVPELVQAPDPEAAVREADIVCTVTASPIPVLEGAWLAPGTHVNAVGAYTRTTRELDTHAVKGARLFVDRRESALAEAGDFLLPLAEGAVDDAHLLGELGDLLEGSVVGRASPEDITLFKSLGLAVQDLAAVAALVERLEWTGVGTGTGPASGRNDPHSPPEPPPE